MTIGWGLLTVTFLLVVVACGLFVLGFAGWAQLLWVLASGTAGAGFVLVLDDYSKKDD
jgi:O-antigen ligase